MIWGQKKGL